jgi:hypothetical protein
MLYLPGSGLTGNFTIQLGLLRALGQRLRADGEGGISNTNPYAPAVRDSALPDTPATAA